MRRRVRLTVDLTDYDSRLVAGSLGWTCPRDPAMWGVMVRYDNGAYLDTLWKSLEELEDETAAAQREEDLRRFDYLVTDLLKRGMVPQELRSRVTKLAHGLKKNGKSNDTQSAHLR